MSEIQDKRVDREKKKMDLFFLKKQVADETARLRELKQFLDQNLAGIEVQEQKKEDKLVDVEKYQQRLREKKEYLQRLEAENSVEEEQISLEKSQLEKDRVMYTD